MLATERVQTWRKFPIASRANPGTFSGLSQTLAIFKYHQGFEISTVKLKDFQGRMATIKQNNWSQMNAVT